MVPSASELALASSWQVASVQEDVNSATGRAFGGSTPSAARTKASRAHQFCPSIPGPLTVVAVPATGRPAEEFHSRLTRLPSVEEV